MSAITVLWGVGIFIGILFAISVILLIYIGVDTIVQKRKKKRAKKAAYDYSKETVVPGPYPEAEQDDRSFYTIWMNKEMENRIELIQLRTKVQTPGEVMYDALHFYTEIVNMFNPGDHIALHKPSENKIIILPFKPLSRIEKKVEG